MSNICLQICEYIDDVYTKGECFLLVKLNYERIKLLQLEVNVDTIKYSLCTSKLKLKPADVKVQSETILTVHPNRAKNSSRLNFNMHELKDQIPNVVIKVCISFSSLNCFCVISSFHVVSQSYSIYTTASSVFRWFVKTNRG